MSQILLSLFMALAEPSLVAGSVGCCSEAYDSYLKGRRLLGKRTSHDLREALKQFSHSIATDADCAPAYAGRAHAHALLYDYPEAREAALEALTLDPHLAEAHASLGFVRLQADWDWTGAERSFQRAIALDPQYPTAHQWYAICLEVTGRGEEAIAETRKALDLEPASALYNLNLGFRLFWARRYDQAIEQFHKTLAVAPDLVSGHYFLGRARVEQGEFDKAIRDFRKAEELSPGDWNVIAALGHLYAKSGRSDKGLRIASRLEKLVERGYPFRSQIASIYAALGKKERALEWLGQARDAREGPLLWLKVDPRFDSLRSDPRFEELLRRMNFPPAAERSPAVLRSHHATD